MKKLIITTIALSFGVVAFSKTEAELIAGLPTSDTKARIAYCAENASDIEPLFAQWSQSDIGKYYTWETPNVNETAEAKDNAQKKRSLFAPYYYGGLNKCEVSANCALRLSPQVYYNKVGDDGYKKIKSDGWIIEGVPLPECDKIRFAICAKDCDVVFKMDLSKLSAFDLKSLANQMRAVILSASDYVSAKEFCNEYEKQMLIKNVSVNSAEYQAIQSVGKYLTQRVIEQKLK